MSSSNAPFGLRPAFHPSGLDRAQALAGGIASGYATDILKGQPVKLNSSGDRKSTRLNSSHSQQSRMTSSA